ncbi:hypothetical protein PR002_g329 [Phytophthora rubi]|uniref:Pyruvate flavodoxin/ferredoxin oxidoreductase pyrimidine binding domain-containing protein n=1 Tax=Phytophthora rubi TaxID=129364 RepID=A0A6A3NSW8_9STRA|nr:hypothetical protein PR002_g329 [Phytophthora rubi]
MLVERSSQNNRETACQRETGQREHNNRGLATPRPGAADAVRGALAGSASLAALIPSQTLLLFLPNIFQLARGAASSAPALFHVACESIRSGMTISSSYEQLYALQHSGALLLNSTSPQECHDLAVVAHVAQHLYKLLVYFYDGAREAREIAKVITPTEKSLVTLTASTFGDYLVYEYFGTEDAEYVVVVVGEAAAALKQATACEQILGDKVGVVNVHLLLPGSHKLFAQALSLWSGGEFRNLTVSVGMARTVIRHSATSFSRRAFVVSKSEGLYYAALVNAASESSQATKFNVVLGEPQELDGSVAYTKPFLLYGFDDVEADGARAATETISEGRVRAIPKRATSLIVDVLGENDSDTPTASLAPSPLHKLRATAAHSELSGVFVHTDRFCCDDAVPHVTGHVSSSIFDYPLLAADASAAHKKPSSAPV